MTRDSTNLVRLAAVQASPAWLDRDKTVDKVCAIIAEAGDNHADLVGFPESFIPGHPSWYYFHATNSPQSLRLATQLFEQAVEIPGSDTDRICEAAAAAQTCVVLGLNERRRGTSGTLYNTQVFIDSDGTLIGKHQKLMPTMSEHLVHSPGAPETQRVFDSTMGTLSGLICGENSNPLAVAMVAGAYPAVHVAAWPNNFGPGPASIQNTGLLAARNVAYMSKSFVISSCMTNSEAMIQDMAASADDEKFMRDPSKNGGACIISPSAEVLTDPMPGDQEGIVYADVDLSDRIRGRALHDFAGGYNRADVYRLVVDNRARELISIASDAGAELNTRWIDDEFDDRGALGSTA